MGMVAELGKVKVQSVSTELIRCVPPLGSNLARYRYNTAFMNTVKNDSDVRVNI